MDMEDAVRLNAAGVGIQVFIGGEFETRSIHNMTRLVDAGLRVGMPVMGVTAVGRDMVRDAKYFRLACRIIAEMGAQYVKTYYVADGFETVTASCPVPIVMAGGQKLPELDALTMAYNAVQQGASRRRYGPQHLPVRRAEGDDRGGPRRCAQEHEAQRGARHVRDAAAGGVRRRPAPPRGAPATVSPGGSSRPRKAGRIRDLTENRCVPVGCDACQSPMTSSSWKIGRGGVSWFTRAAIVGYGAVA